jgi:hypothetical protein
MIEGMKYPVIYADPPWKFRVYSEKGGKKPDRTLHLYESRSAI